MTPVLVEEAKQLIPQATYRINKQGYRVLHQNKNQTLFKRLRLAGFFDFHVTNCGNVIGLHQAVAFCDHGWKALLNGFTVSKGSVEVHHEDSNPTNNCPSNLSYRSCEDHKAISWAVGNHYPGHVESSNPTPFNRLGQAISNHKHFLANAIKSTLKASKGIEASVVTILMMLPEQIHRKLCNVKCMIKELNRGGQGWLCVNTSRRPND